MTPSSSVHDRSARLLSMLARLKKRAAVRSPSISFNAFVSCRESQHCSPWIRAVRDIHAGMGVHNFNNTWLNALLTKKQQATAKIQIICSRQRCRKSNFEQRSISKFIAVQVIPRTCGWYLRSLDVLQLSLQGRLLKSFAFLDLFPRFWTAYPRPLHFSHRHRRAWLPNQRAPW